MKLGLTNKIFLSIVCLSVLAVIFANGYKFVWEKDYNFIVEAVCDPESTICFQRDCSTGECPINEYDNYRTFNVRAADFSQCADNSCLRECEDGVIDCEEEVCDEIYDSCSGSVENLVLEKIDEGFAEPPSDTTSLDPLEGKIIN